MKACEYLHRASGMHREESLLSGKCMDDGMYRTKSEISRRSEADSRYEQIRKVRKISGGDALRGNTRSHPEHDG